MKQNREGVDTYNNVLRILRDVKFPQNFAKSSWLKSSLVTQVLQQQPDLLPQLALKAALDTVLAKFREISPQDADLLQARFWEGLSFKELMQQQRPRPLSEPALRTNQRIAIQRFTELMLHEEQLCQAASNGSITAPPSEPDKPLVSAPPTSNRPSRRFLAIGAVALALSGTLMVWASRPDSPSVAQPAAEGSTHLPTSNPAHLTQSVSAVVTFASVPSVITTPTTALTTSAVICGETSRHKHDPALDRFLRHQGVSNFRSDNTTGGLKSDQVRIAHINSQGLWIGYRHTDSSDGGLGFYDRKSTSWAHCIGPDNLNNAQVNAIVTDFNGVLWVGTEEDGIYALDASGWHRYGLDQGLPSEKIYALTVDNAGTLWAGTWEGVGKFDGKRWTIPYSTKNGTLFSDHVLAIAFEKTGDIWVGHLDDGISHYTGSDGKWSHHTVASSELSGNAVRTIVLQDEEGNSDQSVWIGTADGGISLYQKGSWSNVGISDSLPSNQIHTLAIDHFNRVWAGTSAGAAFFDGARWHIYNTLPTLILAFGLDCPNQSCAIDNDHVWTAVEGLGLTHSRLPFASTALDVIEVCFIGSSRKRICPNLGVNQANHVVTATYPITLSPGEKLQFLVTVSPRPGFKLANQRGDYLSNTDAVDTLLFGAYYKRPTNGETVPGQPFEFAAADNPLIAPQLLSGKTVSYISTWRVWMFTRYAGPSIRLVFTVAK